MQLFVLTRGGESVDRQLKCMIVQKYIDVVSVLEVPL